MNEWMDGLEALETANPCQGCSYPLSSVVVICGVGRKIVTTAPYLRNFLIVIRSNHHIRFWYLRCCGCPGLRGRQHLATPHTRSP